MVADTHCCCTLSCGCQNEHEAKIELRNNLPRTKPNVVIFTNALSVLCKLQNPRQKNLNEVETALADLAAQSNLTLSGFQHTAGSREMNRKTSLPGREASSNKRTDKPLTPMKRPSSKPSPRKKKWKQQHQNYNQSDSLHKLRQTRAGYSVQVENWTQQIYRPRVRQVQGWRVSDVPMQRRHYMTVEHLLQHCRLHDALRRDTWPEPTLLRDKLYGNLEELRRTAAFVRTTGISILAYDEEEQEE